jgi:hypothetical protein
MLLFLSVATLYTSGYFCICSIRVDLCRDIIDVIYVAHHCYFCYSLFIVLDHMYKCEIPDMVRTNQYKCYTYSNLLSISNKLFKEEMYLQPFLSKKVQAEWDVLSAPHRLLQ